MTHQLQSNEIDIIAIGRPGVRVIYGVDTFESSEAELCGDVSNARGHL